MPLHGEHAAGAAMRRRQRRLRSWLRHERMTVAMTLAEMTHHTAPRGPKMARVGEGVEHEQHDGLRAQKPPLPGERPGCLVDPGRSGATASCGAPQGIASRPLACRYWLGRRERQLTPSLSPSSRPRRWRTRGRRRWRGRKRRRRPRGGRSRMQLMLQWWNSVRCCCCQRSARRPRRSAGLTNSTSFFTLRPRLLGQGGKRKRGGRRRPPKLPPQLAVWYDYPGGVMSSTACRSSILSTAPISYWIVLAAGLMG